MLVQSHEGVIDLLPALPKEWREGDFSGVFARGAFELSFSWVNSKLTQLTIQSKAGAICTIQLPASVSISCNGKPVAFQTEKNGSISFATQKGNSYVFSGL
jgi:alpha-L-fucosidase 2